MEERFVAADPDKLASLMDEGIIGDDIPLNEGPGTRIGRYKLLQLIGEGGFGSVFMAEQQTPVVRKVALKVIKPGMDSRAIIARFEAERQALAMMDHPNIARVLDASTTEAGRPYFVMELVQGIPINEYCDRKRLTPRERIELFIPVCRAVQHAHQKGIIHRDLKPSNILVMIFDGQPVPKVIDFGVAKALNQRLTEKTLFTQFGHAVGTPEYMSPEQAEMDVLGADTRSDVYSLGALLYELLTGVTPLDRARLREVGYAQMLKMIREEEPLKPSTRLTLSGDALANISSVRGTDAKELTRLTAGDLDWVVMKCLEKDRARRYESAAGLARDLERYLHDEPVEASPPSAAYTMRKLVRKHKREVVAGAAIAVALIGGTTVSTILLFSEREAKHRAVQAEENQVHLRQKSEIDAARSRQVVQFLSEMLRGVGPLAALGRDTTMLRDILDKTAKSVDELKDQPEVEAELLSILGNVYYDLSDLPHAAAMQGEAVAIRKRIFGDDNLQVAQSLNDFGRTLVIQERFQEGERALRQALAIRRRLLGSEHPDVADSLDQLAGSMRWRPGKFDEAESLYRQSLAMRRKLLGSQNLQVADTLLDLGTLLRESKPAEGEAMCRESLAIRQKLLGPAHPRVASSLYGLGLVLTFEGKFAEAEAMHREALSLRRKLLPHRHSDLAESLLWTGRLAERRGDLANAETLLREAVAITRDMPGTESIPFHSSLHDLTVVVWRQGKLTESQPLLLELTTWSLAHPKGLPQSDIDGSTTPYILSRLIDCYRRLGQKDKAAEWEAKLHALINVDANPSDAQVFYARAELMAALWKFPESLDDYRRAVELDPDNHLNWHDGFVPLLLQTGDFEGYRHWRTLELQRFGATADGMIAHRVAKDALMTPADGDDLRIATELADKALATLGTTWTACQTKGMAEYRSGHYQQAVPFLIKSRDLTNQARVIAPIEFFLAMSYQRLGERRQALAAMDRGRKCVAELPTVGDWTEHPGTSDWILSHVAQREAEQLINEDASATQPGVSTDH